MTDKKKGEGIHRPRIREGRVLRYRLGRNNSGQSGTGGVISGKTPSCVKGQTSQKEVVPSATGTPEDREVLV